MLSRDWWIRFRQRGPIKKAIERGFSRHCWEVVREIVEENEGFPSRWVQLWNVLQVAQGADYRKKTGESATTNSECLSLGTLLKIEPKALVPERRAWLFTATRHLCRNIERQDIGLFVEYCLFQFEKYGDAGEQMLASWSIEESELKAMKDSVMDCPELDAAHEAIERVAIALQARLEEAK